MITPDLDKIAADLEGLEETIIARLIDRAQFRRNRLAYQPGKSGFKGETELSLFALRLKFQEEMDACFGRFAVPEERPFNKNLPDARRIVRLPDNCLRLADYNVVNLTEKILTSYLDLVPLICAAGDDAQYGSSVEHDVYTIQAISRRIHYGAMYVAETKYLSNPATFEKAVDAKDSQTLETLLTRQTVEQRILRRVQEKVRVLQATAKVDTRITIDPGVVKKYYAAYIIPLTKEGEILYLLNREN
ncbi:chorismate mutase [Thermodesulfobacteriota bacterium]